MVFPESPPPAAGFFGPTNLLVRAPGAVPTALGAAASGGAGDAADSGAGSGLATTAPGGWGETVEFETPNFVGRMKIVFRLPPEQQAPEAAALLAGKKRQLWVMLQGRLRVPVGLDDLLFGTFFSRALRAPAPVIVAPAVRWLASRFGSALHVQLRGDSPCVVGPLCAAVQTLNISRPGEEPPIEAATEDSRLLFGPDAQRAPPLSSAKRRAYFAKAPHRAGKLWSPGWVLTLHTFDHAFNYATYRMAVPPCIHLDMVKCLDGQPVDISLYDRASRRFLLSFEVWNRRMLPYLEKHRERIARRRTRAEARRATAAVGGGGAAAAAAAGEGEGAEEDGASSAADAANGGAGGSRGATLSARPSAQALAEAAAAEAARDRITAHAVEFDGSGSDSEAEGRGEGGNAAPAAAKPDGPNRVKVVAAAEGGGGFAAAGSASQPGDGAEWRAAEQGGGAGSSAGSSSSSDVASEAGEGGSNADEFFLGEGPGGSGTSGCSSQRGRGSGAEGAAARGRTPSGASPPPLVPAASPRGWTHSSRIAAPQPPAPKTP